MCPSTVGCPEGNATDALSVRRSQEIEQRTIERGYRQLAYHGFRRSRDRDDQSDSAERRRVRTGPGAGNVGAAMVVDIRRVRRGCLPVRAAATVQHRHRGCMGRLAGRTTGVIRCGKRVHRRTDQELCQHQQRGEQRRYLPADHAVHAITGRPTRNRELRLSDLGNMWFGPMVVGTVCRGRSLLFRLRGFRCRGINRCQYRLCAYRR